MDALNNDVLVHDILSEETSDNINHDKPQYDEWDQEWDGEPPY